MCAFPSIVQKFKSCRKHLIKRGIQEGQDFFEKRIFFEVDKMIWYLGFVRIKLLFFLCLRDLNWKYYIYFLGLPILFPQRLFINVLLDFGQIYSKFLYFCCCFYSGPVYFSVLSDQNYSCNQTLRCLPAKNGWWIGLNSIFFICKSGQRFWAEPVIFSVGC